MNAGELWERLVEERWAVVLASGLCLIAVKNLLTWEEPLVSNVLLYIAAPIFLAILLRFRREEIGLSLPEDRRGWAITGLLLVGAVVFAFIGTLFPSMMEYYPIPIWGNVEETGPYLAAYEAGIAVLMLATELMYRGWLVLGTQERLGRWSVLVSAVLYALFHLGKPMEEVVFSFFAGIVFGLADLEAKSILPSFAAHFAGSALFDMLALGV